MKNQILFYYHIDNIELSKVKGIYYFRYCKQLYSFEKIQNVDFFVKIIQILNEVGSSKYFPVIPNIYNEFLCNIDDQWYALFLHTVVDFSLLEEILRLPIIPSEYYSNYKFISWDILWRAKVDYYEYQLQHIFNIYPVIDESFFYYIGMAENAISYIKYNLIFSSRRQNLYLCHKRIDSSIFFHPKNVIIDYRARDVAEYIKYLFFSNSYHNFSFFSLFKFLNFSYDDFVLLYSRLLFPSYFFDIYDNIVAHRGQEEELKTILMRVNEYNSFLVYIHETICRIVVIPSVSWIKKEMS